MTEYLIDDANPLRPDDETDSLAFLDKPDPPPFTTPELERIDRELAERDEPAASSS
jgi:hypothetical protein